MFIVRNRNRASGTECHRVAQECHRCFPTANPRRGGGYRGFFRSVTDFPVNIKKQGKRKYKRYIEGGYVTL